MNVSTILAELAKTVGAEAVREACLAYTNGSADGKVKKAKRERKPRGKSSWNLEVDRVREEMMSAHHKAHPSDTLEQVEKAITYKNAYAEASERRRKNNPEAQVKYDQYKERSAARRAERKAKKQGPVASSVPAPLASEDEATEVEAVRAARICPECEDAVPAPSGARAGGDGSHRSCIKNGMTAGKWRNPSEWEEASKQEGKRRAEIEEAESNSRVAAKAEPKKRGRPAKKAENA